MGPIRLNPGLSLTGRVVDPEGRPVVGALIEPAGTWAESANSHRSGPDGRFTIPNLGRGIVRVNFTFGNLDVAGTYVVDGKARTDHRPAPPDTGTAGGRGRPAGTRRALENWRNGSQLGRPRLDRRQGTIDRRPAGPGRLPGFLGNSDPACTMLLPALDRLREKFEPRGVVFLSIHTPGGTMDQIRKLYELKKVSLVSAIDVGPEDQVDEGTTARMYGVWRLPDGAS